MVPRDKDSLRLPSPGGTPLVELPKLPGAPSDLRVFGKLESVHAGGSIKDRPVRRMLDAVISSGTLGERRILDSSSGNAGIAYAMMGAVLGLPVTLVVPGNASRERLERIRAHGAELILTDPMEGYDFALNEALRLGKETDRYLHVAQYSNEENWRAHYFGTGAEIVERVTAEFPAEPVEPAYRGEVARRWRYADGEGEFGVITSVTQPFCGDCTRARLSAEGVLYTCLFAAQGTDLRDTLRSGGSDETLRTLLSGIWSSREDRYSERRFEDSKPPSRIEMSYIGG